VEQLIISCMLIGYLFSWAYFFRAFTRVRHEAFEVKQDSREKEAFLRRLISASSTVDTGLAANSVIQQLVSERSLKFQYASLLMWLEPRNKLVYLGTNIPKQYSGTVLEHINELYDSIPAGNAVFSQSKEIGFLEYPFASEREICAEYLVPLYHSGKFIGALYAESSVKQPEELLRQDFFKLIIENLSLVLNNIVLMKRVLAQANEDSLTKLYNRNYLLNYYDTLRLLHCDYALILLDIDFFKSCNDTYGHLAGDYVLKEVSNVLQRSARLGFDGVFRYGGEEFLIILRDAPKSLAMQRAEEIRQEIQGLALEYSGETLKITISAGVFNADITKSLDDNLICADKALYYSKRYGRNRVTEYSSACDEEV